MPVSLVVDEKLCYPDSGEGFSPSQRYPEYPFDHLASRPNPVYDAVRRVFQQLELDEDRFGTPGWNPLGEIIVPGSSVFVLCNFVYHRRPRESRESFAAKCIHGSVLRALCDYLLIAVGSEGRIEFGNSALQSCDWSAVLEETGASAVAEFYRKRNVAVRPKDLRLYVVERGSLGHLREVEERDDSDAVEMALGSESMLGEIAGSRERPARFRIADYRPERIEKFHAGDQHRYVIHRSVLDADVIVSLSKLKTHEKVGITCGMKGFVGTVGHKDCLAHHRFGSPAVGGDEYPMSQRMLLPVSYLQDWMNGRARGAFLQPILQIFDRLLRRALRRLGAHMGGAWYGNDTAWRMALDLARIVHYADARGVMCSEQKRVNLSLIDGVVAGEGEGPLNPKPVEAGTLIFSDNVAEGDLVACRAMGFDSREVRIVGEVYRPMMWPLVSVAPRPVEVIVNGARMSEREVRPVAGRSFEPPPGWRGRLGVTTG